MQRMMLAAVQATDERLIALQYLMWISAHLAVSSLAQKDDSHWGTSLDCRAGVVNPFAHKKNEQQAVHYGTTPTATSKYFMFINDVIVTSL